MQPTFRPYQNAAKEAAFSEWRENTSTLIVLPTGTGKTVVFAGIIRQFLPGRSLVLAHREELIFQAKEKLESAGVESQIEMGDLKASSDLFMRSPCVIATVQTLHRRLDKFDPNSFALVVVDEVHHGTAGTYRKILDHFRKNADLKVLGVTATPDRADEEALGQIMDSVAYDYEIVQAIQDGWLTPVEQQVVHIADLDFSHIRTTAGDLNGADLAAVMEAEKNLQGVCGSGIEIIGDRQTILFASSVIHAEKACEIFNRHRANMATFICGTTDIETRRQRMTDFKEGRTQVLTNVGIATEGTDLPNVSVILMGRPTQSRALYAQMAGRAMRPLPGLVDCFDEASDRREAIAASRKPSCLLVDYAGNSGRHKLMTSADILGGKVSEEAIERAKRLADRTKGSVRMVEVLTEIETHLQKEKENRKREDEARRAKLVAKVQYSMRAVNPFDVFGISPVKERGWDDGKTLSEKQRAILLKQGIDGDKLPYSQAKQLLNQVFKRWDEHLASYKQCQLLKRQGVDGSKMDRKTASELIDKIAANHWHFTPEMLPGTETKT